MDRSRSRFGAIRGGFGHTKLREGRQGPRSLASGSQPTARVGGFRTHRAGETKESRLTPLPCVNLRVHLYRIMTEVCAGGEQRNCTPGQRGLATVWVQSDSEENALRQARQIIDSRQYHSVGELTAYLEHTHGTATTGAGQEDALASGYTSMKEKALASADGLFEIWFPPK